MGHAHDHCHPEDAQTYYLDQLCTIALCGTFGAVAVMLWYHNLLKLMLVSWMHIYVMIGGVTLIVLAVIRGIVLWFSVDRAVAGHQHNHEHEHHHHHHDSHDHH